MLADQNNIDHKKIDKMSLWIIAVVGFFVVIGGVLQIRSVLFTHDRTLVKAFQEKLASLELQQNDQILADSSQEAKEIALLQTRDTDGDSLNDFEETYAYGTSPYLTDSDSDTVSDADELAQQTNPNCPQGQDCEQVRVGGDGTTTDAEAAFSNFKPSDLIKVSESGDVDTEEIRKQLIEAGVPEDVVNETDDETLVKLFNETVEQTGGSTTNTIEQVKAEAEALKKLSTQEKRNLLVEAGVNSSDINALTEDQLNQLFDDAVTKALEGQGISTEEDDSSSDEDQEQDTNQ